MGEVGRRRKGAGGPGDTNAARDDAARRLDEEAVLPER
jgi:hypothetical protein